MAYLFMTNRKDIELELELNLPSTTSSLVSPK